MKRSDIHRPSTIVPAEYEHLWSFSYPGVNEPGQGLGVLHAMRTGEPGREPRFEAVGGCVVVAGWDEVHSPWGKLPFACVPNGGCDVCGAHYRHGDVFRHVPTGECIVVGHICADKMNLHAERGEWVARQRALAALRKTAEYQRMRLEAEAKRAAQAAEFLLAHPGLEQALDTDHRISRDLRSKLAQYGSLSEKQIALAHKLHREASEPKQTVAVAPVPAGRSEVEGVVVSVKTVDTDFGATEKMLVRVATPVGEYRIYGTVPRALRSAAWAAPHGAGADPLRGARVRFTAALAPKEPGFGFFSRPTGGELILQPSA